MEKPKGEKIQFIRQHVSEIKPLVGSPEIFKKLDRDENLSLEETNQILETYRVRIFNLEKPTEECEKNAKRIIMEMSETLAFLNSQPIIDELKKDKRCRSICLLADNLGGQRFVSERKNIGFDEVEVKNMVMEEIPKKIDVALTLIEPSNSPNTLLLYNSKSVFGAKKLYLFSDNFFGISGQKISDERFRKNMDKIDGIFVINELIKNILLKQMPDFPEDKIFITGAPVIDSAILDNAKQDDYKAEAGKKLGLGGEDLTILYAGGGAENNEAGQNMDRRSCALALQKVAELATQNPQQKFAFLIRPHPADPEKDKFFQTGSLIKPDNLKIISAGKEKVSIQEAVYSADVIVSIAGTENFVAPFRGKRSIFVDFYKEEGKDDSVMKSLFPQEVRQSINDNSMMAFAESSDKFFEDLKKFSNQISHDSADTEKYTETALTSAKNIMNILLS